MASIAYSNVSHQTQVLFPDNLVNLLDSVHVRPCMVVSSSLLLAGLSLPFLMLLEILAVTLLLFFVSLALVAAGVVLGLVYCGEI